MAYASPLKKFCENLQAIIAQGSFIHQADLSTYSGVDIRTIRKLRRSGVLEAKKISASEVWISTESIKRYCSELE